MVSRSVGTLSIAALAFVAGWMTSRHYEIDEAAVQQALAPTKSWFAPSVRSLATPSVLPSRPVMLVADSQPTSPAAPAADRPAIPTVVSTSIKVYGPESDPLLDVIRDPFPEAKVTIRKINDDGTFASKDALEGGDSVFRNFNSHGQVTSEEWKQSSGDDVMRTFYDNGGIKGFSLKHLDGSVTNITFTLAGVYKARSDEFPDGTKIITHYDDQGRVLEKWRTTKEGQPTRIQ